MKILYLIHQFYPEYYTGTEKFVMNLATMMQKFGEKVKIITYSFYDDSYYDRSIGDLILKEFMYKGIQVIALRHKKIPAYIHYALENQDLSKVAKDLISREKPDVVHVGHTMRVGDLVQVLPLLNIPYIVTLTDFFLICPKYTLLTSQNTLCSGPEGGRACQSLCPELPSDFIARRLETARDILFNAELVISPSKFLASLFQKEFPDLRVKITSYGLKYSTTQRNEQSYSKGKMIVFCYAGSLNSHKGVHILIDAFKRVRSSDTLLKIYGSGLEKSYINQLMDIASSDKRIEFCGVYSGDKVGEILSNADVVIIPSIWYENTPIILREALACNVPVIASDVGGMTEDIQNGVNGFFFKMGDSQHLQEILQTIVDNPEILNGVKHHIKSIMIPTMEQEAYAYARAYAQIGQARKIE